LPIFASTKTRVTGDGVDVPRLRRLGRVELDRRRTVAMRDSAIAAVMPSACGSDVMPNADEPLVARKFWINLEKRG
jgi:hypothetical protein